ncbi:putative phosphoglucomutase, partial [Corchorus capsularis]
MVELLHYGKPATIKLRPRRRSRTPVGLTATTKPPPNTKLVIIPQTAPTPSSMQSFISTNQLDKFPGNSTSGTLGSKVQTYTGLASSSSSSTTIAEPEGIKINSVPTKPIEGQKTGTSGLRKK